MGLSLAGLTVWFWPDGNLQEASLEIPVKLESLPADLIPAAPPLKSLTAKVRGTRSALSQLASLKPAYTLDLAAAGIGEQSIPVHPQQLQLPGNISVVSINVSVIHLVLEKVAQKEVPIIVALVRQSGQGLFRYRGNFRAKHRFAKGAGKPDRWAHQSIDETHRR